MSKLSEVVKYIRSKNAGPFWVTVDIFCDDNASYERIVNAEGLKEDAVAKVYGVTAEDVKVFHLPDLKVVKISFPRHAPQGSPDERDMHAGQQYIPLLNVEV